MPAEPADNVRVVKDVDDREVEIVLIEPNIRPYVIKGDCPDCGATVEHGSLEVLQTNTPHEVNPICLNCGTELSMMVQINMSVEVVDGN